MGNPLSLPAAAVNLPIHCPAGPGWGFHEVSRTAFVQDGVSWEST